MEFITNWRGQRLYEEATRLYQCQDYPEALKCFRQLKKLFPDWSEPLANMASCYYYLDAYDRAMFYIDQALAIQPDLEAYLFNKTLILAGAKELGAAAELLQRLLEANPSNRSYVELYGNVLFDLGRYADALKLAADFLPQTDEPIPVLLFMGDLYEKLERYEDCVETYSEVLRIDAEQANALNNRGFFLMKLERYEEAKPDFDKAIDIQPKYAIAFNNRGFAHLMLGDLDRAFADMSQALSIQPKNAYIFRNLGYYFLQTKNRDQAREYFQRALDLGFTEKYGNEVLDLLEKWEETES